MRLHCEPSLGCETVYGEAVATKRGLRLRAQSERIERVHGLLYESQGHNLASTVLHVCAKSGLVLEVLSWLPT